MALKRELIERFMMALGILEPSSNGKWLMGQCPLAPFTHKKGVDRRPSFGINTETSNFNCFTCESGSLEKLVGVLEMYTQQNPQLIARYDFKTMHEILQGLEDFLETLPEFEETFAPSHVFTPWPGWFLENYVPWRDSQRAQWYLHEGRKALDPRNQEVSPAVADALKLLYDPGYDRVVSPFWTWGGQLAGARGRACDQHASFKHYDYTWNKTNNSYLVWYGEDALVTSSSAYKPVVIVEGQFDCANVRRVYPHCMASLTAKGSAERLRKLQGCDEVLIMLDNDETGDEAFSRYVQLVKGPRLGRIRFPKEFKDPAQLPEQILYELFKEWL